MAEIQSFEQDGRVFSVSVAEQHQWFWQQMRDHVFEPETFDLYKKAISNETLYIDIGSWIGPTVLYGGSLAKRVIAVEPIALSMVALLKNLELNEDILRKTELYNLAIAPENQVVKLYNHAFGDGMASIFPNRGALSMTFMAMGIDDFLGRVLGDEAHVFIKVDIEGGEFALVPKMCGALKTRNIKADLYISVHGSFAEDAEIRTDAYAGNLKRHGILLQALTDYGEVRFASENGFDPIDGAPGSHPNFAQLLVNGGIDTTLFVKAR